MLIHIGTPCSSILVLDAYHYRYFVLIHIGTPFIHIGTPCSSILVLLAHPDWYSVLFHISIPCSSILVLWVLISTGTPCSSILLLRAHLYWYFVLVLLQIGTPFSPILVFCARQYWYSVLLHICTQCLLIGYSFSQPPHCIQCFSSLALRTHTSRYYVLTSIVFRAQFRARISLALITRTPVHQDHPIFASANAAVEANQSMYMSR